MALPPGCLVDVRRLPLERTAYKATAHMAAAKKQAVAGVPPMLCVFVLLPATVRR